VNGSGRSSSKNRIRMNRRNNAFITPMLLQEKIIIRVYDR